MSIKEAMSKRNMNLDFIRAIACMFLICLHFFLNTEWYQIPQLGNRVYVSTITMSIFRSCVPLFLLLTGYLVNKKELSLKYYKGLNFILSIYLLSSSVCLLYSVIVRGDSYTFTELILGITQFKFAEYSWYINMYIGLFLIIPFLNIVWNHKNNRNYHHILLGTLIFLSTLVSVPFLSLLPNWWSWQLYPITYYFLGAFLNKYSFSISTTKTFIYLLSSIFFFGTYNFIRSNGMVYVSDAQVEWGGVQTVIISILLFVFLLKIDLNKIPVFIKVIVYKISECSLGIYLVSSVFDNYFYGILNNTVLNPNERILYFPICGLTVFLFSFITSQFMLWIYKIASKFMHEIYGVIRGV